MCRPGGRLTRRPHGGRAVRCTLAPDRDPHRSVDEHRPPNLSTGADLPITDHPTRRDDRSRIEVEEHPFGLLLKSPLQSLGHGTVSDAGLRQVDRRLRITR